MLLLFQIQTASLLKPCIVWIGVPRCHWSTHLTYKHQKNYSWERQRVVMNHNFPHSPALLSSGFSSDCTTFEKILAQRKHAQIIVSDESGLAVRFSADTV